MAHIGLLGFKNQGMGCRDSVVISYAYVRIHIHVYTRTTTGLHSSGPYSSGPKKKFRP